MNLETYFTYETDLQQKITALIEDADTKIQIAVAWITDNDIIECIISKSNEIQVEIILTDDNSNDRTVNRFKKCNSEFLNLYLAGDRDFGVLQHHKFCIIDDYILITGSYNWTNNSRSNYENVDIHTGDWLFIEKYINRFDFLKKISKPIIEVSSNSSHLNLLNTKDEKPQLNITSNHVENGYGDKMGEAQRKFLEKLKEKKLLIAKTNNLFQNNNLKSTPQINYNSDCKWLKYTGFDIKEISKYNDIEHLVLSYSTFRDLKDLKIFYKLKSLILLAARVKDIAFLEFLINLEVLDLSYTKISDISPLKYCVNLKKLYCIGTREIQDYTPILELKNLKSVEFGKEVPNLVIKKIEEISKVRCEIY